MATLGLKGIWGLEQLERTGIATWKLGVLLIGGGVLVGAILIPILGEVKPDSVLASFYTPRLVALLLVVFSFVPGFFLFWSLFLARTTEIDLRLLALVDDTVNESIKRLQPTAGFQIFSVLCGMVTIPSIFMLLGFMPFKMTILGGFTALHSSGLVLNVVAYPLLLAYGLAGGVLLSILSSQFLSLVHASRQMKIDLLQLSHYSAIANPAVRLFGLSFVGLGLLPLMILFVDDTTFTTGVAFLGVVLMGFTFLMVIPYAYPILILRNRIRAEKLKELNIVFQALEGDDDAINAARIRRQGVPLSIGDLLTHQMFVESRWEWPIASHVHQLILFGLFAPCAWALAATIEYALYG